MTNSDKNITTKNLCGEVFIKLAKQDKTVDLIFENYTLSLPGFPDLVRDSVTYKNDSQEYNKILEEFSSKKVHTVNIRADIMATNILFEDDGMMRCPLSVDVTENKHK